MKITPNGDLVRSSPQSVRLPEFPDAGVVATASFLCYTGARGIISDRSGACSLRIERNYKIVEIVKDDSNLFRAILHSSQLTNNNQPQYKQKQAVNKLISLVLDEHIKGKERKIGDDDASTEINRASRVLKIPIDVYTMDSGSFVLHAEYGDSYKRLSGKRISILLRNQHYDSIHFEAEKNMDVDALLGKGSGEISTSLSYGREMNRDPVHVFLAFTKGSSKNSLFRRAAQGFCFDDRQVYLDMVELSKILLSLSDFGLSPSSVLYLNGVVNTIEYVEACSGSSIAVVLSARIRNEFLLKKELNLLASSLEKFSAGYEGMLPTGCGVMFKVIAFPNPCNKLNSVIQQDRDASKWGDIVMHIPLVGDFLRRIIGFKEALVNEPIAAAAIGVAYLSLCFYMKSKKPALTNRKCN